MNIKDLSKSILLFIFLAVPVLIWNVNAAMQGKNGQLNQAQTNVAKQARVMLTWLTTLDKNEIAAAKLALNKKTAPSVKKFAQTMVKDHTHNLQQTDYLMKRLGEKPIMTSNIVELKSQGQKELHNLKSLKDNSFDGAFINAMVKGHAGALKQLDQYIESVPSNSQLSTHLKNTRDTVYHHLEAAQSIQKTMG